MKIVTLCSKQAHVQWPCMLPSTSLTKYTRRRFRSLCVQKKESNIHSEEFASCLKDIMHVFDFRDPAQLFLQARSMKRHFIFHAGPTNSGKTHNALEAFFCAKNAIYCSPLRMLAAEIYHKSNARSIPCDMLTGEEKLWAVSCEEPSNHTSCTVEMCSNITHFDVAVIDEVQMLRCVDRGWAWTRALLGVPAQQIHLCGEEAAIPIVQKLLSKTDHLLQVKRYDRITPLKILNEGIGDFDQLQAGDCVVSFSQTKIYSMRIAIERAGLNCAVVYGNLPSKIRSNQAEKFNTGVCDVLIASDAIGMGLNLNIRRIIFSALTKFDGSGMKELTPYHTKHIAGRAGRYKTKYETGFVTTLDSSLLPKLKKLIRTPNTDIKKAGILPSFEQLELLSLALPGKSLLQLLEVFEALIQLNKNYFLCDMEKMKLICQEIAGVPLTLPECHTFAIAPVMTRSSFVLQMMKMFAWYMYYKNIVSEDVLKDLLKWTSIRKPGTIYQLQHLEYIYEVLDLYRWLSFRPGFEDIFCDTDAVIYMQKRLRKVIRYAVNRNLKVKKYHRPSNC